VDGSETDRGTKCNHQRVCPQAAVAVEDTAARTDDGLHLRLNRPPLCQRGLVHHLDHGFPAPHRVEKVSERSDVGIKPPGIVSDPGIGEGNSDLVVRPTRYEPFVKQASVGIEIDQVTIVWCATRANERRQALVVRAGNAIEHLIDDTVDAGVSGVIERNARRQRVRERAAGIVEALISETRAGVVPGTDSVGAGKPFGILALIGLVARFRNEKGAAAKAENGAGRKRRALIGTISAAGIAAGPPITILIIAYFIGALAVLSIGFVGTSFWPIMTTIFLSGFFVIQLSLNAYITNYYPTAIRGTGVGWSQVVGRLGSLSGPLVGGALVSQGMAPNQLFQVSSLAPLLACVFLLLFAKLSRRKPSTHGSGLG
jgi:hypothetical protein